MRMGVGILSLLISVAIILWLMVGTGYLGTVSKTNVQLKQQVNVMAGNDPTGTIRAVDSIHCRVDRTGSRPKLLVTEVMEGGPMQMRYDIRAGDRIVEIASLDFDQNMGSLDAAMDWIHTAYAQNGTIVVMRKGEKLTLPTAEHLARLAELEKQARIASAQQAAAANTPTTRPTVISTERNSLQQALDSLRSSDK